MKGTMKRLSKLFNSGDKESDKNQSDKPESILPRIPSQSNRSITSPTSKPPILMVAVPTVEVESSGASKTALSPLSPRAPNASQAPTTSSRRKSTPAEVSPMQRHLLLSPL